MLFKLPKIIARIYKIEINIRSLNSAGVSFEHFGSMEKLSLQISRKLGSDNWCINNLRQRLIMEYPHMKISNF